MSRKPLNYDEQSITYYLPNALLRGESSLILATIETQESFFKSNFDYFQNFDVNPMTCDVNTLDWLATNGLNPWRNLWQPDWQESTKRLLLKDTQIIFSKRLFAETISLLFSHFNLLSRLVPKNGFILAVSLIPATLGTSIIDYNIELPIVYKGGIEEDQTRFIADNFGLPGFIPFIYV